MVPVHTSLDASGKSNCTFASKTKYTIQIPAGVIADPAGNAFAGTSEWTFTTKENPECVAATSGSATTAIVVCVVVLVVAGAGFFWWHRKKMRNQQQEAPQEGDVVQTSEGTHQVRLVPVFQPPGADDGRADAPAEEPPAVGKKGGAGLAGADSLAEPLAQSEELGQV